MIWRSAFALASRGGANGRLSILIFHRVLRDVDPLFPGEPYAARFDALVHHLKSRFTILPLSEGVRRLCDQTLPARALSITFDDGYADNLDVAAPILHRHAVPATVFVATGFLDGGAMFNDVVIEAFRRTRRDALDLGALGLDRLPLVTVEQRRAAIDRVIGELKYRPAAERNRLAEAVLDAAGVPPPTALMMSSGSVRRLFDYDLDIGAHSVTHPILAQLRAEEARHEIVASKRRLEELIDREVTLFAYPNGRPGRDYTAEHVRMVKDAGFAAAVTTAWGAASRDSDVFQLPRFTPWSSRLLKFDVLMLRNLRNGPEERAA
jgi:peptidoglycan/xylan/chitin deacetylase (PgdA/CDA1 family)